jgi:hypothetical protein
MRQSTEDPGTRTPLERVKTMEHTDTTEEPTEEKRESFRVEDVLPLVFHRVTSQGNPLKARLVPAFSEDYLPPVSIEESPDELVSPYLWKVLVQINNRLGLILHKLQLDDEGLSKAEAKEVSISTSGVKFSTGESFSPGDVLEVKILLPLEPACWIVVYGDVMRTEARQDGQVDVAVRFSDTGESVCEAINQYALKRQRELIRKRKGM